MKKILIILLVFFTTVLSSYLYCYADTNLRLYYNDNVYYIESNIIQNDGEYFIDLNEFADKLDMRTEIDNVKNTVTFYYNNTASIYPVRSYDYSIVYTGSNAHAFPEIINGTVYLPFKFMQNEFGLTIKYDKTADSLYFFPSEESKLDIFTNITNNYYLKMDESYYIDLSGTPEDFNDSIILFNEKNDKFSVVISCDKVNSSTIGTMRLILNDYNSNDKDMFNRIIEYKKSYFRAMQDLYKNDFYLGGLNESLSESNIKVIKDYNEVVFGQDSNILMYNTMSADKNSSKESTHLSITVPSYNNMTIYTINFTGNKGFLSKSVIQKISIFLNNLSIKNLPKNTEVLQILTDEESIQIANAGIYPVIDSSNKAYIEYLNVKQNYKVTYPVTFVPYLKNSITDSLDYLSYKIDYTSYFSISVEQINDPLSAISDKINFLKSYNKSRIQMLEHKNIKLADKNFNYLRYELEEAYTKSFVEAYFFVHNKKLYTIALNSKFDPPSDEVANEFVKIVESLYFINPRTNTNYDLEFINYSNPEEGYSFDYPKDWLLENKSNDINFDKMVLSSFDYSGPIDIYVNESRHSASLSAEEVVKFLTGADNNDLKKYISNYIAPYENKAYKVLNIKQKNDNNVTYLYKLINYLDNGDRYKLCYSIDIIRDKKINSLFISSSEYITENGGINDTDLDYIVNHIAESFSVENTREYLRRKSDGEKRNRKIVLIERWFKIILDRNAVVTHAKYLDSQNDVLVYIDNCKNAGAYRIDFDYWSRSFSIINAVEQTTAAKATEEELRKLYKNKLIYEISFDSHNMTAIIHYSDSNLLFPIVSKMYNVEIIPERIGYNTNLIRNYTTDSLRSECKAFLENQLLTDVSIYFPSGFNYSNNRGYNKNNNMQLVPLYAEFDKQSGYFLLEIDTVEDSIEMINYLPDSQLMERLNNYFKKSKEGYSVINYLVNKKSFQIDVFLLSNTTLTVHHEVVNVRFDDITRELLFEKGGG